MIITAGTPYAHLHLAMKHIKENMKERPPVIEALNALQYRLDNNGKRIKVSGRAACIIETAFTYGRFNYSKLIPEDNIK